MNFDCVFPEYLKMIIIYFSKKNITNHICEDYRISIFALLYMYELLYSRMNFVLPQDLVKICSSQLKSLEKISLIKHW